MANKCSCYYKRLYERFWQYKSVLGSTHVRVQRLIAWQAPPVDFIKINVDEAGTSNLRMLTAGGLCRDNQGQWILGFMLHLGQGCILQVELHAIVSGLKLDWQKGFNKILLESNSLLVVNKVNCRSMRMI